MAEYTYDDWLDDPEPALFEPRYEFKAAVERLKHQIDWRAHQAVMETAAIAERARFRIRKSVCRVGMLNAMSAGILEADAPRTNTSRIPHTRWVVWSHNMKHELGRLRRRFWIALSRFGHWLNVMAAGHV